MSTEIQCTTCLEPFESKDLILLPCTHSICTWCLKSLFQAATVSEESFPATCCSPIPPSLARPFLTFTVFHKYETLTTEYEATDKTYCSNEACKRFIKADSTFGRNAICRDCKTVTCTECKAASHGIMSCMEGAAEVKAKLAAELAALEAQLESESEEVKENITEAEGETEEVNEDAAAEEEAKLAAELAALEAELAGQSLDDMNEETAEVGGEAEEVES
jgi:hypothetical protein